MPGFWGRCPIGGGLLFFSFGPVEERNENDELVGTFGYLDIALLAAGGIALSEVPLDLTRGWGSFAAGSRLKLLGISTISGAGGFGFGLDGSFLLKREGLRVFGFDLEEVRAGLAVENLIGLGLGPPKLKAGLAARPLSELILVLDLGVPFELHLGGEVEFPLPRPLPSVALRLGSFVRGGVFSFTFGLGVTIESFQVDYAFISHPQLPGSHRLALSWHF